MSIIGTVLKIAVVVGATFIGQRLYDRQKYADLWLRIDHEINKSRHDPDRRGLVRANVRVSTKELIQDYRSRLLLQDSVVEFDDLVEIYIESIPD